MFQQISYILRGSLGLSLAAIYTCITGISIFIITPFKLALSPFGLKTTMKHITRYPFNLWCRNFGSIFRISGNPVIRVHIDGKYFNKDTSSLLICNHQSWADIPLIANSLQQYISSPTFFLKKELLYIPFLGSSAWALDMIIVNRLKKRDLKKNSNRTNQDLINAREKCRNLKDYPSTVINFVEGTRFTSNKHLITKSKYKHLLSPKAGGLSFALNALQKEIPYLVDVSICYHTDNPQRILWDLFTGEIKEVDILLKQRELKDSYFGDYLRDREYRKSFQADLNQIWHEKDLWLTQIKKS